MKKALFLLAMLATAQAGAEPSYMFQLTGDPETDKTIQAIRRLEDMQEERNRLLYEASVKREQREKAKEDCYQPPAVRPKKVTKKD